MDAFATGWLSHSLILLADTTDDRSPFVKFFIEDWYISIPMLLMSLAGIWMVGWRLLLNHNGTTSLDEFLPVFQEKLKREGVEGALRYCRSRQDIIPRRLYTAGLDTSKQGAAAMRRSMANVAELEILPDLNFLLPPILAIAKIATMVGLLGTVISMVNTFNAIKGSSDPKAYSDKIGLALCATAIGLVTAIPLVFAHVLLKAWVAKFEVRMKSAAQKLLVLLQAKQDAGDGKSARTSGAPPPATSTGVRPGIDPSAMSPRK